MAYTTQKKGYLGFIIAGAVASASGGSLLGMGFMYLWMGGLFQSIMGDMDDMGIPFNITGMFSAMGIGMAIGGACALVVGLVLLGTGVSKRNAYKAATAPVSEATSWMPETSVGREYAYTPSPAYGTISAPVSTPAPMVMRCRSCGETLPERTDALFCPSCGAPTR
jgi:hypothetical protein